MKLTDEELDQVTGGVKVAPNDKYYCYKCHENSGPEGEKCSCGGVFLLTSQQNRRYDF